MGASPRYRGVHPPALRTPLVPVAVAMMIGISLARQGRIGSAVFAGASFVALLGVGFLILSRDIPMLSRNLPTSPFWLTRSFSSRSPRYYIIPALLLVGFAGVGGLRYELAYRYCPPNHIVTYCPSDSARLATLRGTILTDPYITNPHAGTAPSLPYQEARTLFILQCTEVLTWDGWRSAPGRCRIIVKEPILPLQAGQQVQIDGRLSRRRGPRNWGQFDPTDYHRAGRTVVSCVVENTESVQILRQERRPRTWIARVPDRLRKVAQAALIDDIRHDEDNPAAAGEAEAFLSALLLGERHLLATELKEAFIRTGTLHFLSISGLHVGIVAGLAWGLGRVLRWGRRKHGLFVLGLLLFYVILIPSRPPILRAGIIGVVFCVAFMSRRPTNPMNLLALAAIIILVRQPVDLFNAGFQLSFTVVAGLILFVPVLYHRLIRFGRPDFPELDQPSGLADDTSLTKWVLRKVAGGIAGLAIVSLVAWGVGLPLGACHFHRLPLWAAPASVVLYPLIALTMLLGQIKFIVWLLAPAFSAFLAAPLSGLVQAVLAVIRFFNGLPGPSLVTAAFPFWILFLFYGLLTAAGWFVQRSRGVPRTIVYLLLIWGISVVWLLPFRPGDTSGKQLTMNVLDVGQGSATVIELPDVKTILYDIGSSSRPQLTSYIVGPFLQSRGIWRIDAVFISHPNLDHYNGLEELNRMFPIGRIFFNDYFPQVASPTARKMLDSLREDSPETVSTLLRRGWVLKNPAKKHADYHLEVLWPGPYRLDTELSPNDSSTVLRIRCGRRAILLCGDIGIIPQQLLLELEPAERLKTDVLLAPHHGSASSLHPDFLRAVDPCYCLISTGKPVSETINRIEQILPQARIVSTDQQGGLCVKLTHEEITLRTFLKR